MPSTSGGGSQLPASHPASRGQVLLHMNHIYRSSIKSLKHKTKMHKKKKPGSKREIDSVFEDIPSRASQGKALWQGGRLC